MTVRKQMTLLFTSLLLSLALLFGLPNTTWASSDIDSDSITPNATYVSHNEETGYYIYIDDWADLLTDAEEEQLLTQNTYQTKVADAIFNGVCNYKGEK